MTDELKPKAKSADDNVDYFDNELRVDDTDGCKVFHVGKHYTKGADYHEQRKDFWLDLAKREAMIGNSSVVESALTWAEKHANLTAGTTSAASMSSSPNNTSTILTKAVADEIRNMVTTESKTDFNRNRLKCMVDQAKVQAQQADRRGMEDSLAGTKEFAEKVGLYNDELELEMKDIPSLVSAEVEVAKAIREIPGFLEYASAAARVGYVRVVADQLICAEESAALAGIDIEEKVRNITASLTPELQKEFKKVHDEKVKAIKVAANDKNAVDDKSETKATENANEMTVADDEDEVKVVDNDIGTTMASKREDKITEDVEMKVAEDETLLENNSPSAELSDDGEMAIVDDKAKDTEDIRNDKIKEPNTDDNGEVIVVGCKPVTEKTGDYHMTITNDKTRTMIVATTDNEMTGACGKPEVKIIEEDKEMAAVANVAENSNEEMIVDPLA